MSKYGASRGSVACPTPSGCGTKFHIFGTTSARKCQARSTRARVRTAPGAPPRTLDLLAPVDQDWTPGTLHPTGGYDQVVVVNGTWWGKVESHPNLVKRTTYLREGELHRTDGPAVVGIDYDDYVEQGWYADGELHRGDGPAAVGKNGERTSREYHYRGRQVAHSSAYMDALLKDYLKAGVDPEHATGWLDGWYTNEAGTTRWEVAEAAELSALGMEPLVAAKMRAAGVQDTATFAAVAAGELPISWALAGAQSP